MAFRDGRAGSADPWDADLIGHWGDNAACEGVFGMLKREWVQHRRYRAQTEARADVFDYIERFHKPRMRPRSLTRFKSFQPI